MKVNWKHAGSPARVICVIAVLSMTLLTLG